MLLMYILYAPHVADASSSSLAIFNDSRCEAGGVCPYDPLLFTCELNNVFVLRIVFPTDYQEYIATGDTIVDVALPLGFTALSLNISIINDYTRNYSLTIAIMNASLLNGGAISCDDSYISNVVMARCPIASMFTLFSVI